MTTLLFRTSPIILAVAAFTLVSCGETSSGPVAEVRSGSTAKTPEPSVTAAKSINEDSAKNFYLSVYTDRPADLVVRKICPWAIQSGVGYCEYNRLL